MLDQLKEWIHQRLSGSPASGDFENLPKPVMPGQQNLASMRLIVLDLETTGLNPAKDEVIAIGAVAIEHQGIALDDQFDLILRRPELDISETVLIHGIGKEALTRGHELEDALLHLLEWMDGDPVLAFHSAFDQKFLEKTLKHTLGYTQPHCWMDVAEVLPAFFPNAKTGGRRLDNWSDYFGLEVSERHHAAADAMATAELMLICLNQAIKSGVNTLSELNDKLRYYRRLQTMQRL